MDISGKKACHGRIPIINDIIYFELFLKYKQFRMLLCEH